jgi:hypothetical protein
MAAMRKSMEADARADIETLISVIDAEMDVLRSEIEANRRAIEELRAGVSR